MESAVVLTEMMVLCLRGFVDGTIDPSMGFAIARCEWARECIGSRETVLMDGVRFNDCRI